MIKIHAYNWNGAVKLNKNCGGVKYIQLFSMTRVKYENTKQSHNNEFYQTLTTKTYF